MDYMRQSIEQIHPPLDTHYPLKNMKILDIGCGGGLLSEVLFYKNLHHSILNIHLIIQSLARLGASVTGVDAAIENIEMAKYHQTLDPILVKNPIEYIASTAGNSFSLVTLILSFQRAAC